MADNNFAPSQGAGGPFALSTTPGVLNYQGKRVALPFTLTQVAPNTTTFVFLDAATRAIATSLINFPGGCYPIAIVVSGPGGILSVTDQRPDVSFNGLEFLNFGVSAGNTTGVIPIPLRDYIWMLIRVRFYSIADIVAVQMCTAANPLGDLGLKYTWRFMVSAAGVNTWTNVESPGGGADRIQLADAAITGARTIEARFINSNNKGKALIIESANATQDPTVKPIIIIGRGEYTDIVSQVNGIILTDAGGNAFGADIAIFGKNFS